MVGSVSRSIRRYPRDRALGHDSLREPPPEPATPRIRKDVEPLHLAGLGVYPPERDAASLCEEHELVEAQRIGDLRLEVLEGEIDLEPRCVLVEQLTHGLGVGCFRSADPAVHEPSLARVVDAARRCGENGRVPVVEGFVIAEQDVDPVRAPVTRRPCGRRLTRRGDASISSSA